MSGEKEPHDATGESAFLRYPIDKVVGIIDDPSDVQAALRDLHAAGFTDSQIQVLTGEAGARRLDVKGDKHGLLARIVRSTQDVLGDYEIKDASRYEQELLAGHFGIGVTARDNEDRDRVRQSLKSHNGHFINFYTRLLVEALDP